MGKGLCDGDFSLLPMLLVSSVKNQSKLPKILLVGGQCLERVMGYSRKYPHPPLWTTLNWVPKNFRISKKDSSGLCRIPNPACSNSWGIPEFCNILNDFPGIPVKRHKILGKFMEFQSGSPSIYFRISIIVHRVCVDIF